MNISFFLSKYKQKLGKPAKKICNFNNLVTFDLL